jgi:hypothetical protein
MPAKFAGGGRARALSNSRVAVNLGKLWEIHPITKIEVHGLIHAGVLPEEVGAVALGPTTLARLIQTRRPGRTLTAQEVAQRL